jgi:hypothetical protein
MTAVAGTLVDSLDALDWLGVEASLNEQGFAKLPVVLDPAECDTLACLYVQDTPFRSCVDMARYRFGSGEYKYFAAPLPPVVQPLREAFYAHLRRSQTSGRSGRSRTLPTRIRWTLGILHAVTRRDRAADAAVSPIAGDYNCLHQDIYGNLAFPLQVVFALSQAGEDYQGGEFLLVEQRPRAQSRGHSVRIEQGAGQVHTRTAGWHPRRLPGQHAPRREHRHQRIADDARASPSRTPVNAADQ